MNADLFNQLSTLIKSEIDDIDNWIREIGMFQSRYHITRFLEHYEIFKLAKDRPGHVVELGVFRGWSFLNFAQFIEILNVGDRATKIIGFDTFKGFPKPHDRDISPKYELDKGPYTIKEGNFNIGERAQQRLLRLIDLYESDKLLDVHKRVELVIGDISETIPKYVKQNPGLRISFLHLDCDLYEPTLTGLKYLYPLVTRGGIVLFDQYGIDEYPGESAAFDEYFGKNRPVLTKSHLVSNPTGYFIKQE